MPRQHCCSFHNRGPGPGRRLDRGSGQGPAVGASLPDVCWGGRHAPCRSESYHEAHMRLALGLKPGHAFLRHACASPSQTRRVLGAPTSFSGTDLQGWHIGFPPFKVQSCRCFCVTDFGELPQISLERGINKSPTNVSRWSDQAHGPASAPRSLGRSAGSCWAQGSG